MYGIGVVWENDGNGLERLIIFTTWCASRLVLL